VAVLAVAQVGLLIPLVAFQQLPAAPVAVLARLAALDQSSQPHPALNIGLRAAAGAVASCPELVAPVVFHPQAPLAVVVAAQAAAVDLFIRGINPIIMLGAVARAVPLARLAEWVLTRP
jgi:hypothetical protein